MSKINGGKFGHGFASAGVTQSFSGSIDGIGNGLRSHSGERIFAAAILGGVTSAATGGKFANGAVTAAFSRAFNDEPHQESLADERHAWREQSRCKGSCHGYNGATGKEVGFSFVEDTGIPYSYGTYTGGSAITPAGGVNGGINGQFFSDGTSDSYLVAGVGWGWDIGYGAEANYALYLGDGDAGVSSWTGRFDSLHISAFGGTISYFYGGDWHGISLGASTDGFGFSKQINEYTYLTGN